MEKKLHTRQDLARCVHSFNFAVKYESDGVWAPLVTQQENDLAAGNIRVIETPKTLQNCVTICRDTCKNFSKSP